MVAAAQGAIYGDDKRLRFPRAEDCLRTATNMKIQVSKPTALQWISRNESE